ncbi:MAG: non-homologous end-joining DNA ligase [Steroidobacteraceae bacterium]
MAHSHTVVHLTHPDRVLIRSPRITKSDLADFYRRIADFIIPGLINRPLMLLRCPDGASGACFFQKHGGRGFPAAIRELHDRAGRQRWIYIEDLEGLMALVQMNCLEYHTWGATIADLDQADRLVIDLDPGAGVRWKVVIDAALTLRARLADLGLECFVRTSGGKGLHVVVPLRPTAAWNRVHGFARALAEDLAQDEPRRFLAVATRARRRGRIFLDYQRNARGSTAVCSYSLRNRPGAPLATPLSWDELPRVRAPDQFRFGNIARRLARLDADPWAAIERVGQSLPELVRRGT